MRTISIYNNGKDKVKVELTNENEIIIDGRQSNFYLPLDISSIHNIEELIEEYSLTGRNLGKNKLYNETIIGYVMLDLYTVIYQKGLFKDIDTPEESIVDIFRQYKMFTMCHLLYNPYEIDLALNSYSEYGYFFSRNNGCLMINSDIELDDPVLWNIPYYDYNNKPITLYTAAKIVYNVADKLIGSVKNNIERHKHGVYLHKNLYNQQFIFLIDYFEYRKIPSAIKCIGSFRCDHNVLRCNVTSNKDDIITMEVIISMYNSIIQHDIRINYITHKAELTKVKYHELSHNHECFEPIDTMIFMELLKSDKNTFDEFVELGTGILSKISE